MKEDSRKGIVSTWRDQATFHRPGVWESTHLGGVGGPVMGAFTVCAHVPASARNRCISAHQDLSEAP